MNDPFSQVAVVDDDSSVRRSLDRLLRSAGFRVKTFDSAETFFANSGLEDYACAVLDVQMPGLSGLELQGKLRSNETAPAIVFLTGHGDIPMSVEAMKRGAVDFLTKPVDEDRFLPAIKRALARHTEERTAHEHRRGLRRRLETLTEREEQVLRCLLTGALNKQIADHLGIAEKTVKVHRARVLEKMEVASLVELTRMCGELGIKPDEQLAERIR